LRNQTSSNNDPILLRGRAAGSSLIRKQSADTVYVPRSHNQALVDDDAALLREHVARVEVQSDRLLIDLADPSSQSVGKTRKRAPQRIEVPWRKTSSKMHREILVPDIIEPEHVRPIRAETRATLVTAIARGRRWLNELVTDPSASTESIAKREGCSIRKVTMTISLAFLAPNLVKAAIEGRLPHGMGVVCLADLSPEWSRQHQMLGLPMHDGPA
jgi:hypothetical protein